eukprot:ANDGO_04303.mRNA.1 Actin-related protein 4
MEDYYDDIQTAVICRGSYITYAGFAGADSPPVLTMASTSDMASDYASALASLGVDLSKTPLLVVDAPGPGSLSEREQVLQLLVEDVDIPYVAFLNSASAALFSVGDSTGLVIDIGHSGTTITPVVQGDVVRCAVTTSAAGGKTLSAALKEVLLDLGKLNDFMDGAVDAVGTSSAAAADNGDQDVSMTDVDGGETAIAQENRSQEPSHAQPRASETSEATGTTEAPQTPQMRQGHHQSQAQEEESVLEKGEKAREDTSINGVSAVELQSGEQEQRQEGQQDQQTEQDHQLHDEPTGSGFPVALSAADAEVERVKTQLCHVVDDFDRTERKPFTNVGHNYGRAVYAVPEFVFFRPSAAPQSKFAASLLRAGIGGVSPVTGVAVMDSIIDLVLESLEHVPREMRDNLLSRVLITGSVGAKLSHFTARLRSELSKLLRKPSATAVQVETVERVDYLASWSLERAPYCGGAMLANMDIFKEIGIKRDVYEEEGPASARRSIF